MRALVLAAGWATRLGALATDRPKHLLPVAEPRPSTWSWTGWTPSRA